MCLQPPVTALCAIKKERHLRFCEKNLKKSVVIDNQSLKSSGTSGFLPVASGNCCQLAVYEFELQAIPFWDQNLRTFLFNLFFAHFAIDPQCFIMKSRVENCAFLAQFCSFFAHIKLPGFLNYSMETTCVLILLVPLLA